MKYSIVGLSHDPRKDIAVNSITPDDNKPLVVEEHWTQRPVPLGRVVLLGSITFIVVLAIGFFLGVYVFCKIKGPIVLHSPIAPSASNVAPESPKQDQPAEAKPDPTVYPYYSDVAKGDKFSCAIYELYGDGRYKAFQAAAYQVSGLTNEADPGTIYIGQRIYFPAFILVDGVKLTANNDNAKRRGGRNHCGPRIPVQTPAGANAGSPANAMIHVDIPPVVLPAELSESYSVFPLGIQDPELPQPVLPTRSVNTVAADGYRIIIPRSDAKGIRLKKTLETCLVIPQDGISRRQCQFSSWAKSTKSHDVELRIYIPELPNGPFRIIVASVNRPFDGDRFIADATPFNGRIPGSSRFKRGILMAQGMGIRGGIGVLTMGPIGGVGLALGPPLMHTVINHFAAKKEQ